jgi:Cu+-exporting ATPase
MKTAQKSVSVILPVEGMTCASCVSRVEKTLRKMEGVSGASVNFATEKVTLAYDPARTTPVELAKILDEAGYRLVVAGEGDGKATAIGSNDRNLSLLRRDFVIAAVLTVIVIVRSLGDMIPSFDLVPAGFAHQADLLALLATTIVLVVPGRRFLMTAWKLARHGTADMSTLVAVGTGAAYIASLPAILLPSWSAGTPSPLYFDTTATIITLVLLGKMLEARAKKRTGDALARLMKEQPKSARVLRDGTERELPLSEIRIGDRILLRPGEKIPVDGTITEGLLIVDESMITGESVPAEKKSGVPVIGGSVAVDGSATVQATAVGSDTVIARMIRLVEEAQGSKAPIQALADRIAAVFVPAVIASAVLTFILWLTIGHASLQSSLMNFVAVMIIACPCALGLATPTAIISGGGRAASRGILIRDAESLQRAGSVETVIFDKTGTITAGTPVVRRAVTAEGVERSSLLRTAAAIERHSLHPFARAIVGYVGNEDIASVLVEVPVSHPGRGIEARVDGRELLIGSLAFVRERGVGDDRELVTLSAGNEQSAVFVAVDRRLAGVFLLHDPLNDTSVQAVKRLDAMGIETVLLSGDRQEIAEQVGKQAGIGRVIADVLPDEKAAWVKRLQAAGRVVGMVGDGINDAPALAQADVGIAMGRGIDLAIECAGITLMRNDLNGVADAITISRKTVRTIKQNLFWAFIYNAIGIPLAALGLLHPMLAAAAMALSSVSVVTNSLRLRRAKF